MPWGIILEGRDCAWVCHAGPLALRRGMPWCRWCFQLLIETLFHLRAFPQRIPGAASHRECSVGADLLWPRGLQPVRLLCPWASLDENTGVGCPFLLQGISPTQGLNPHLLDWQVGSLSLGHGGKAPLLYLCLFANLLIHWPKAKTKWVKCWLVSCVTLAKSFYLYSSRIN